MRAILTFKPTLPKPLPPHRDMASGEGEVPLLQVHNVRHKKKDGMLVLTSVRVAWCQGDTMDNFVVNHPYNLIKGTLLHLLNFYRELTWLSIYYNITQHKGSVQRVIPKCSFNSFSMPTAPKSTSTSSDLIPRETETRYTCCKAIDQLAIYNMTKFLTSTS